MAPKTLILILSLAFLIRPATASETRVDSAGGLNLVFEDETQSAQPFNFGNPAGLVLLPRQNRFDISGQWLGQNGNLFGKTVNVIGTVGELGNDQVKYHGLILFPSEHFALQLDGDVLQDDQDVNIILVSQGISRTREMLRAAYDFGPFVLGLEAHPLQVGYKFAQQDALGALLEGAGSATAWSSTAGLLARFPSDPGPQQERFTVGGSYSTDPIPFEADLKLTANGSGSLTATFKGLSSETFGPDIYFEVPGSFQAALIGRVVNSSTSLAIDSNPAILVVPSFKYTDKTLTAVIGGFKASRSLSKDLSLKSGLGLLYSSSKSNIYKPDTTLNSTTDNQTWKTQAGIGLEKKDDFTAGLQVELNGSGGGTVPSGGTTVRTSFFLYKVSLGTEKWLSKQWAFRVGLVYENDMNSGDADYAAPFYTVPLGLRVVNATLTTGAGYQGGDFYADFMLWYGQPLIYDSSSPNDFGNQTGFQLAAGFLFK